MKTFNVYDKFDCRCTAEEVGKPWAYRWGLADADGGLCLHSEVGTARPPDQTVMDDDGTPLGALPSVGVVAQMERALALGGTSIEREAIKHSNVLAIVVRHKLEQEERARSEINPFGLSTNEVRALPTEAIKIAILKVLEEYVPEGEREAFGRRLIDP